MGHKTESNKKKKHKKDSTVKKLNNKSKKQHKSSDKNKLSKKQKKLLKEASVARTHKYLDAINVDVFWEDVDWKDSRMNGFLQQQAAIGFDERELWSLDYVMVCLLFERASAFRDMAPKSATGDEKTFILKKYSFNELLDQLCDECEKLLKDFNFGGAENAKEHVIRYKRIWRIFAVLGGSLSW